MLSSVVPPRLFETIQDSVVVDGSDGSPDGLGTVRVETGSTFSVSCSATGIPAPYIVFMKDGQLITDGERVAVERIGRRATITVDAVENDDAGLYSCVAQNSGGETSSSLRIGVIRKCQNICSIRFRHKYLSLSSCWNACYSKKTQCGSCNHE